MNSKKAIRKISPYPELSLIVQDNMLFVKTPWLSLECSAESENPEISDVLSSLYSYPICYIHPKARYQFSDYIKGFRKSKVGQKCETPSIFLSNLAQTEKTEDLQWVEDARFTWRLDELLEYSRIGILPVYDAVAAYSVLRRYIHRNDSSSENEAGIYESLMSLKGDEDVFRRALGLYINQNHYITKNCQHSLEPALLTFTMITPGVQRYMRSELGHDLLIKKSLRELGFSVSELPVLAETKLLMSILRYAAQTNILAFACLLEAFESDSYAANHPLAKILEKTKFHEAGIPLQKHRRINRDEAHRSISLGFLNKSPPLHSSKIIEASRVLEFFMMVKEKLTSKLFWSFSR